MKYLFFVSLACFMLTGCFGQKADDGIYGYNGNLRAPVKSAYKPVPQETAPVVVPQPVVQPAPTPAPAPAPAPAQQPFVQTIVIPQYAPQPMYGAAGMPVVQNMPYGAVPAPMATPAPVATPAPAVTPAPVATPASVTTPAPSVQPVKQNSVSSVKQNKEGVYPPWAASDYTPPTPTKANNSNNIVLLQNANRTETVQCAIFDSLCINSYLQQGYHQISGQKFPGRIDEAGYPQTVQKAESNIPRW